MKNNIDVICQFCKDGTIIPIKFKIEENQEIHEFMIKRYKPSKIHRREGSSYHSVIRHTPNILDYEYIIESFDMEKRVILRFILDRHEWKIIY